MKPIHRPYLQLPLNMNLRKEPLSFTISRPKNNTYVNFTRPKNNTYANFTRPQIKKTLRLLIIGGDTNILFDYVNSLEPYTVLHTYNTLIPKCRKYDIEVLTKQIFNSFDIIVILDNYFNYLLNELMTNPTQICDIFISGKLKLLKHTYTKYIHIHDTLDISQIYSIVYPTYLPDRSMTLSETLPDWEPVTSAENELLGIENQSKDKLVDSTYLPDAVTPINLELKKEYSFCFIVCSYNNEINITKNLESIMCQTHTNWRCIYINDASTDKTDELFHEIIRKHNVKDKFTYIKNEIQMKQSYCKYIAYQLLNDFEIVCLLDGDDWLYHENVLNTIQSYYMKNDIKILTSNYAILYEGNLTPAFWNHDKSIYSEIDKQYNTIRYVENWLFRHLKTGLSILFKSISKEYLMMDNEWLDRCTDCAEMFCVAEYANSSILQVPDVLYTYNKDNSLLYSSSYYVDKTSTKRQDITKHLKTLPKCKYALPNTYIINLKSKPLQKFNMCRQMDYISNPNYWFIEATDGNKDNDVHNLSLQYEQYILNNTQYQVFPKKPNIYNNTRKHCTKPVIGLIKSIETLCLTIKDKKDMHVLILEDDVYTLKDFNKNVYMNSKLLKDIDVLYLGCHNNKNCIYDNINSDVIFNPCNEYSFLIYGGYSMILSKKFTDYLLSTDFVSFCLRANMSWDIYLNYIRSKKIFNFCIYYKQLFIPNVCKEGIQSARNNDFYTSRNINMEYYNL